MSIIDDLKTLSTQQRHIILRFTNRLRKQLPAAHTIIVTGRPGIQTARVLTDYELIVFVNECGNVNDEVCETVNDEVCETVSKRSDSELRAYGAVAESYPVCDPGLDYIRSARQVDSEESEAMTYGFKKVYEETRRSYLKFLSKHLMLFVKREYMSVITVNAREMEKSSPHYYRLYMNYQFKTGYVIYNRDVQSIMTIHLRV